MNTKRISVYEALSKEPSAQPVLQRDLLTLLALHTQQLYLSRRSGRSGPMPETAAPVFHPVVHPPASVLKLLQGPPSLVPAASFSPSYRIMFFLLMVGEKVWKALGVKEWEELRRSGFGIKSTDELCMKTGLV